MIRPKQRENEGKDNLPLKAVGNSQNPLLGNENTATNVSTGFTLQRTLPGPPSRATCPTSQYPLVHPGSRTASTVYQGTGKLVWGYVTHHPTELKSGSLLWSFSL